MNDFNGLAPIYDLLVRLVFGSQIIKSQTAHFDQLVNSQNILLPGGGTGQVLEELDKLKLNLSIDYIEKSTKMLEKAKERRPFNYIEVRYIEGDILKVDLQCYDVIITNFFLDVFDKESLSLVVDKLSTLLLPNGKWLMTDFVSTNVAMHQALIVIMYRFFKLTANLQGTRLLDFEKELNRVGFGKNKCERFYHKMIESCVYSKE